MNVPAPAAPATPAPTSTSAPTADDRTAASAASAPATATASGRPVEPTAIPANAPLGELLRSWRRARRLSQLELSSRTGVSSRHLSFLETGRSRPSRGMVERLAEELDVPLRERNALLLAAGYAPRYIERPLDAPAMETVRRALSLLLDSHEPYPAIVVDRHWNLVLANDSVFLLMEGVADHLANERNVLRLMLHPEGVARHVVNLAEVRRAVLGRLRRQVTATADEGLAALLAELEGYGDPPRSPSDQGSGADEDYADILVPTILRHGDRELRFFSTCTVFESATDLTAAELMIESFFPADAATAAFLGPRRDNDRNAPPPRPR